MELQYKLSENEIEESLLCLEWKKESRSKYWNIGLASVIAAGCLIGYVLDKERLFLMLLAALSVGVMFAMLYLPMLRRKKRAKKMAKTLGVYHVSTVWKEIQEGFESEHVFTIRTEGKTYCIPKRILGERLQEEMRILLRDNAHKLYSVTTGREG